MQKTSKHKNQTISVTYKNPRGVLVSGRNDRQFVTFQDQPRPARAETGCSGFFEFRFEVVNGTEVTLDSRFQVALKGGAGFQAFPEQAVVSVTARVVAQHGFLVCRQLVQFGDQLFNRQISELWQAFQRSIRVVHIGLVVFSVMDFHRLLVEMRFQCVVGIRQGWQCITHNPLHYCRAAQLLMPRKQLVHYS